MNHYRRISRLVKDNKYKRIAEIGVWQGRLSRRLANHEFIEKLYLVDPFHLSGMGTMSPRVDQAKLDEMHAELEEYFFTDDRVKILRTTSKYAAQIVQDELDLVFIDADHTYPSAKEDIQLWLPKVRSGGLLAGDDYDGTRFKEVCKAVDELLPQRTVIGRCWFHNVVH